MKKRTNIILGVVAVILICFGIFSKWSEKTSIGIIGGADGPTTIIVSDMK